MIRAAKPQDLPKIVKIAVESVSQNPIPVIIDEDSMLDTARDCLSPANFLWVSEDAGEVVGAVAAVCSASFWHRGASVSVLLFYVTTPGDGLKLMRTLADWIKSRPRIKTAVIEFEPEVDRRLVEYMRRQGFTRESINLSYVRGLPE